MNDEKNLTLDLTNWKIKLQERTRDRMKLQVKLGKDEAQALKNFMQMIKPDEVSEEDFIKGLFMMGMQDMETRLLEALDKYEKDESNDFDLEKAAEGIKALELADTSKNIEVSDDHAMRVDPVEEGEGSVEVIE